MDLALPGIHHPQVALAVTISPETVTGPKSRIGFRIDICTVLKI